MCLYMHINIYVYIVYPHYLGIPYLKSHLLAKTYLYPQNQHKSPKSIHWHFQLFAHKDIVVRILSRLGVVRKVMLCLLVSPLIL